MGADLGDIFAARPLFLPDEVRRMPLGEELLFVTGSAPIRARKLNYLVDAEFAGRFDANPMYAPADQASEGG